MARLSFLLFVFVIAGSQVVAQEWRGLTPLRSTRADVVRLFGQCSDKKSYCEFAFESEEIFIEFSKPDCGVAPDTVLSIQRELLNGTTFAALGLDPRQFKSFDPSWPRGMGYRGYIDETAGLLLKTYGGEVVEIHYIAGKEDWRVCPSYYSNPREFVRVIFRHYVTMESIECPKRGVVAGEKVVITASYPRLGVRLFPHWHTTGGRILEQQSIRRILLDTTGVEEKVIKVLVEINDGHQRTATDSCTFKVLPRSR